MIEKELVINNKTGLHARPASIFVETADQFNSEVEVIFDGISVNAKSIIGVLSLGVGQGDTIKLRINGKDEEEAMRTMIRMNEIKYGEGMENFDDTFRQKNSNTT